MTGDVPTLNSPAAELAVPLSIAVRIEPELIRAIRIDVLPHLDVSAESDLWFCDDLVAARGPDSIVLKPEVLPGLRERLAAMFERSKAADPVRSVWDITERVHASTSPALVLEERVAWLTATRGDAWRANIEDELRSALRALVQGRTGIADWLAGAWPRLPESVRRTKTAWQLRQAASVHTDTSRLPLDVVPAGLGVADLADLAAEVPDVAVAVRLAGGQLELGDIGAPPGAAAVPLLDTDPRIVELLPDDEGTGPMIAVPRGGRVSVAAGPGPVQLLTPRGLVYQVTPYAPSRALVPLPGSGRQELPDAVQAGELDPATQVDVTVMLRPRNPRQAGDLLGLAGTLTGEELTARYGADPADVALAREVLSGYGLTVTGAHASSRRVSVTGPVASLYTAFGTALSLVTSGPPDGSGPVVHRYRTGGLSVPAELAGIVTAVLGLDDRPQARPCVRRTEPDPPIAQEDSGSRPSAQPGLTPRDLELLYAFPQGTDGSGQIVAIIEFGDPLPEQEADQYFSSLGIKRPPLTQLIVDKVASRPTYTTRRPSADEPFSVALTGVTVAGALAPGAGQVVYHAPNTARGFLDAISDAIWSNPAPTVVSIGWGHSEDMWTAQARTAIDSALADAAALGVTVCVAAGDGGSEAAQGDGQSHVYFPASSPHALACGGTSVVRGAETAGPGYEVVWPDTGGGVSDVFVLPTWQASAGVPPHAEGGRVGRGVPDVAGTADPADAYTIPAAGRVWGLGGTGTVAALWAALVCRLAQATGRKLGHLQPLLYSGISPGSTPPGFNAITQGDNGAYRAGPGWDACTGLGSPNGTELLQRLLGGPP